MFWLHYLMHSLIPRVSWTWVWGYLACTQQIRWRFGYISEIEKQRNWMVVYSGCDMISLSLHGIHVLESQNIYHCIIKFAYFETLRHHFNYIFSRCTWETLLTQSKLYALASLILTHAGHQASHYLVCSLPLMHSYFHSSVACTSDLD